MAFRKLEVFAGNSRRDRGTRADAEAFYSGAWLAGIRERYGMDPQIKYFHTACVTDNSAEAVLLPDAE